MRIILACLIILIFSNCGYLDDDGIVFEKQIVGKFHMRQQARSDQITLNYVQNNHNSAIIISDCNKIVYDSIRNEIFIQERLSDYASSYYLIKVIDANAKESLGAFNKKEIFEKTFMTKLDTCNYCRVWDLAIKKLSEK